MRQERPKGQEGVAQLASRYRLLGKLASGGMADVFLAVQIAEASFRRLVVVKRIHSQGLKFENAARLFADEARTIATLNHPHIVKIYDLSRMGGDVCIAMEYVRGESLAYVWRTLCDQKISLPPTIVCKLIVEACEALHFAHTAMADDGTPLRLVHRDICLHNLLLDHAGYLKVIDFGIAKTTAQRHSSSPHQFKGRLSYVAPEILQRMEGDHRVDVYALGLVPYELLAHTRPFVTQGKKPAEIMYSVLHSAPLQLPTSALPRQVRTQFDGVIQRATHLDREQRYQSAEAMAADLRRVAQALGGLAANNEVRDWIARHMTERVAERREIERQAMRFAVQQAIPANAPSEAEIDDATAVPLLELPGPRLDTTVNRSRHLRPLALLALLLACAAAAGLYWVERIPFPNSGTTVAVRPLTAVAPAAAPNAAPPDEKPPAAVALLDAGIPDHTELARLADSPRLTEPHPARPKASKRYLRKTRQAAVADPPLPEGDAQPLLESAEQADSPTPANPPTTPTKVSKAEATVDQTRSAVTPLPGPRQLQRVAPVAGVHNKPQWLSASGQWSGEMVAQRGCGHCHDGSQAARLQWAARSARQWDYFWRRDRHARYARLDDCFSPGEQERLRTYIRAQQAKSEQRGVAGVR